MSSKVPDESLIEKGKALNESKIDNDQYIYMYIYIYDK